MRVVVGFQYSAQAGVFFALNIVETQEFSVRDFLQLIFWWSKQLRQDSIR